MFKKIVQWAQGRHTLFASYFAIMGTILQWFHRLDANYIMLIGAVQGFILGHSIKEDYFASKAAATAPAGDSDTQDADPPGKEPSK